MGATCTSRAWLLHMHRDLEAETHGMCDTSGARGAGGEPARWEGHIECSSRRPLSHELSLVQFGSARRTSGVGKSGLVTRIAFLRCPTSTQRERGDRPCNRGKKSNLKKPKARLFNIQSDGKILSGLSSLQKMTSQGMRIHDKITPIIIFK